MKLYVLMSLLMIFFVTSLVADVEISKTTQVNIPKFGTYLTNSTDFYKGVNYLADTDSKMQGEGFWGNMIAKFFPDGKKGIIYELNEKMMYHLDYENQTFSKMPIEKYFEENDVEYEEEYDEEEEYSEESPYRIIRVDFKVIDTKNKEKINQFDTKQYNILYVMEKEEIETKKIITDSLLIDVFSSDDNKLFSKAEEEQTKYQQAMMKAVGLEYQEEQYEEMLGLKWIEMVSMMNEEQTETEIDIDYSQLKKIKGTPVIIAGSYYLKEFDPSIQPEKKKTKKKKFGGFGLGNLVDQVVESASNAAENKVSNNGKYKKILSYRTETTSVKLDPISDAKFKAPEGFTEIYK